MAPADLLLDEPTTHLDLARAVDVLFPWWTGCTWNLVAPS
ncbi:hypothetical protein SAMN05661080_02382 [Modestobacter sp. DSM 44400]|nr:hypothetical protein SAMN05661080_02382 [Modestobacter sp. DSM 44400]